MKINSKLLIATEDIISYKIGSLKSKFFNYHNNFNIIDLYDTGIKLIPGKLYDKKLSTNSYKENNIIESGLISFKSHSILDNISNYIILQCTIPVGALYYTGIHFNKVAYASDKLIVLKIIDNYNSNLIIDKFYHINLS